MTEALNAPAGAVPLEVSPTAPLELVGLAGLQQRLGTDLGVSGWRTVEQQDITTFARLTRDEQWIHVDPERAKTGPFGCTVQHGFLTLGLATGLLWEVCTVRNVAVAVWYWNSLVMTSAPSSITSTSPKN